ncbi:hypothetical protein J4207_01840 [Candidatus Woesearchaeota archaeon]|nr:hypothetical protein [Candidatus Woesearchaeota archaeon]
MANISYEIPISRFSLDVPPEDLRKTPEQFDGTVPSTMKEQDGRIVEPGSNIPYKISHVNYSKFLQSGNILDRIKIEEQGLLFELGDFDSGIDLMASLTYDEYVKRGKPQSLTLEISIK